MFTATVDQFVVQVDRGKAIVLHLPLFAAHYQSTPTAPRLILLDEVFVGVDGTNRGQLLELPDEDQDD